MHWIYLSPHFDDVALSCGGLVWEQNQIGESVDIWTICAGEVPQGELSQYAESLHQRWQTGREAVAQRKLEDRAACAVLGAGYQHFAIPDAIYRQSHDGGGCIYPDEVSIFKVLHPFDQEMAVSLAAQLSEKLPGDTQLVCPLALGDHVDHQLVRKAAERTGVSLYYYPDYPYILKDEEKLVLLEKAGWKKVIDPLSESGLEAWVESVVAYRSQIGTFWQDQNAMKTAIQSYFWRYGGVCLWRES